MDGKIREKRRASGGSIVTTAHAPTRVLFGIPIHAMTMGQALDFIDDTIARRDRIQIGVVNAAKVVNMKRNPYLGRTSSLPA